QIVGLFASLAERQGLDLHVDAPDHLPMTCDPDHLEKMLVNLISNAFKFTPEGGRVTVTLRSGGDQATILTVTDTGSGISPEEQRHIFDRFYQVDGSARRTREGTGIGLSLVKELVTLHEGTLNVASSEGRGTTFTITLPYHDVPPEPEAADAQAYGDGARPEVAEIERAVAEVPDVQPQAVSADAPVVLLVEDHADLRAYIRSHLDPSFVILEAANGADGLALALEQVPDLILSDVMMSEMDGYTLLDALKQDQRTSHIPVVLLTARADVDSRIAGLERGADAYLAKPFDAGELRACLRGLIAQRQHLRQLWRTALAQPPTAQSEAAVSDLPVAERQFVAQVDALIETHYTDPHFNTDTLAEGLGLTARQLRRKLKALTGQRPGKRLRHYRLEAAYEQLRTPDASVKSVVYAVGYTSPSHFSKQFKQAYGITPSQHRDAQAPPEPD
ncbi:MAG: ATP-binding protein, partial [Bacteroidota bacterium]